jgi:hypothetical protein
VGREGATGGQSRGRGRGNGIDDSCIPCRARRWRGMEGGMQAWEVVREKGCNAGSRPAVAGAKQRQTSAPAGGLWRAATSADPQRRESRFWDWPWIDVIRVKGGGAMVGLAAGQFCRRVLSQFAGWTKRHACKTRTTKLVAENGGSSSFLNSVDLLNKLIFCTTFVSVVSNS